jgi:putative transposase
MRLAERLSVSPVSESRAGPDLGCQRLICNAKVQEDRYYRRFQRHMVGTVGMEVAVDQQYRRFITERTAFLRQVPSQILCDGAVKFRQAYQRFFKKLGGRPKLKKKSGRQAVWLTQELFQFLSVTDAVTGYHLPVGTATCPVGKIPYTAHRPRYPPRFILS